MVPEPLPFRLPTSRDIERLAFEAGVTVEAVCNRAGISTQTFRNWKYDRGSPSLDTVRRLLEAGTAILAEAQGTAAVPSPSRGKLAEKPRGAAKPAAPRGAKSAVRAKAAAPKRQVRRQP